MPEASQDKIFELDISDRLRSLMRDNKLTVSEIAKLAGVSKSAMEKYLAGPSSPRATAIAELCRKLDASADWLLLGKPQDDEIVRRGVHTVMYHLVMNQKGKTVTPFPSAGSDELKLAGTLTDETMRVIAHFRDLATVEAQYSEQLAAQAEDGEEEVFVTVLPALPIDYETR